MELASCVFSCCSLSFCVHQLSRFGLLCFLLSFSIFLRASTISLWPLAFSPLGLYLFALFQRDHFHLLFQAVWFSPRSRSITNGGMCQEAVAYEHPWPLSAISVGPFAREMSLVLRKQMPCSCNCCSGSRNHSSGWISLIVMSVVQHPSGQEWVLPQGRSFHLKPTVWSFSDFETAKRKIGLSQYDDPMKLLETRSGQCGEWANCFTLYVSVLARPHHSMFVNHWHVYTAAWRRGHNQ
jgi:hypothetical protein